MAQPAAKEPASVKTKGELLPSMSNGNLNIRDSQNYRQSVHYGSESSEDSSDCDEYMNNMRRGMAQPAAKEPASVKTKGELLPSDLPPVEDLTITENVANLRRIGRIYQIVIDQEQHQFSVIVQSDENISPLDADSVLFLSSGEALGRVHEIYANVERPKYIIRFNRRADIHNRRLTEGQVIFYSPENEEYTRRVFVNELRKQKGSDASWKDNNEPPDDKRDFSDDEQEKLAKQKGRVNNRNNDRPLVSEEDAVPKKVKKKQGNYNQGGDFSTKPPKNKFCSPLPGPSRASPHTYPSPQGFGSTPSPPNNHNPGLYTNPLWSQRCGSTSPNNRFGLLQRSASNPFHGPFRETIEPPPQSFLQNRESHYQSFVAPPNSCVSATPNYHGAAMSAPQNNVPLQQQFMLQIQEPNDSFLSHSPPNFNTHQNSRTFLPQNQSFTSPTFGAAPATVCTMPSTSSQSFANQVLYPIGTTNGPHNGSLNISQPRGITQYPINSSGHQGPSYAMVQSSAANSNMFPPRITQHNNIHTPVTQSAFGQYQSAIQPPFVVNQSTQPPTCQPPSYILFPTPPSSTQQGFPHPPVLPSQNPPPTIHPYAPWNQKPPPY